MILTDLAEIIYAPHKVFKKLVANPKYLTAILVLALFIGLQVGYEYAQLSKTYEEVTEPVPGLFQATTNARSGNWSSATGANFTAAADHFNYTIFVPSYGYYPDLYGNTSLQISAQNTNNVSATIKKAFNVDCGANGFQNLSMIVKLVQPAHETPQSAEIILYTLNSGSYYTYDLTSELSNASLIGQWNNLTVPIGPNANGWRETGNPTWSNITSLTLNLNYENTQNVSVRISALFFRGQYWQLSQNDAAFILFSILQSSSLQFLVLWLLTAAIMYMVLKGLKTDITWKALFVTVGAALIVMVIRSALCLVATAALPNVYYPFDLRIGLSIAPYNVIAYPSQVTGGLSTEALAAFYNIEAATATFRAISLFLFGACYVWFGILCTFTIGALKPELSMPKRILAAAVAIIITVLILLFFLTNYA